MDVATVCKVGAVPLGRVGVVSASMQRGRPFALSVSVVVHQFNTLRVTSRCNGTSESGSGGLPAKGYNVYEVMHEGIKLPEGETNASSPSSEDEPKLFSPASASIIAASSSIGEGIALSEQSTLSLPGGASSNNRDWRAFSSDNQQNQNSHRLATGLNAVVEKPNTSNTSTQQKQQVFGPSEVSCDEGSFFLKLEKILENDGGKSVDDYKLRAHIFSESAAFFTAFKSRNTEKHNHGLINWS